MHAGGYLSDRLKRIAPHRKIREKINTRLCQKIHTVLVHAYLRIIKAIYAILSKTSAKTRESQTRHHWQ
jgi:hypothetical protein